MFRLRCGDGVRRLVTAAAAVTVAAGWFAGLGERGCKGQTSEVWNQTVVPGTAQRWSSRHVREAASGVNASEGGNGAATQQGWATQQNWKAQQGWATQQSWTVQQGWTAQQGWATQRNQLTQQNWTAQQSWATAQQGWTASQQGWAGWSGVQTNQTEAGGAAFNAVEDEGSWQASWSNTWADTSGYCYPDCGPSRLFAFCGKVPLLEDLWLWEAACRCSYKAVRRLEKENDVHFSHHFKEGFRRAYWDILNGRRGTVPPVPPKKYWSAFYRSPVGRVKAEQWLEGYRVGAEFARSQGLDRFGRVVASQYICPETNEESRTSRALWNGNAQVSPGPAEMSPQAPVQELWGGNSATDSYSKGTASPSTPSPQTAPPPPQTTTPQPGRPSTASQGPAELPKAHIPSTATPPQKATLPGKATPPQKATPGKATPPQETALPSKAASLPEPTPLRQATPQPLQLLRPATPPQTNQGGPTKGLSSPHSQQAGEPKQPLNGLPETQTASPKTKTEKPTQQQAPASQTPSGDNNNLLTPPLPHLKLSPEANQTKLNRSPSNPPLLLSPLSTLSPLQPVPVQHSLGLNATNAPPAQSNVRESSWWLKSRQTGRAANSVYWNKTGTNTQQLSVTSTTTARAFGSPTRNQSAPTFQQSNTRPLPNLKGGRWSVGQPTNVSLQPNVRQQLENQQPLNLRPQSGFGQTLNFTQTSNFRHQSYVRQRSTIRRPSELRTLGQRSNLRQPKPSQFKTVQPRALGTQQNVQNLQQQSFGWASVPQAAVPQAASGALPCRSSPEDPKLRNWAASEGGGWSRLPPR